MVDQEADKEAGLLLKELTYKKGLGPRQNVLGQL